MTITFCIGSESAMALTKSGSILHRALYFFFLFKMGLLIYSRMREFSMKFAIHLSLSQAKKAPLPLTGWADNS